MERGEKGVEEGEEGGRREGDSPEERGFRGGCR